MFACIYAQKLPAGLSLAEFVYSFSPLVEETAPDTAVIDVEGCALRFGSPYELATEIARQAKSKAPEGLGCRVNVALAANPDTAIYAAKYLKGLTFISPGEELTALGELPIERLFNSPTSEGSPKSNVQRPTSKTKAEEKTLDIGHWALDKKEADKMSALPAAAKTLDVGHWTLDDGKFEEILQTLRLWGVRTFKEFAELPVAGVSERLGQGGLKLRELASGKSIRHLKLRQGAPEFNNTIELEYAVAELEPLAFILARLLNQICANLNAYALATNALRVEMKLENGATHEIKLNLPYPMRDHKVFLKLLLLDTEMHPPPSAVMRISITCDPVKPRVLQTGLFIPLAPEPEKLELMLARLAKLVGAENIGSPEVLDTHRPDAFRVKRFELKEVKRRRANGKQQTVNSKQQAMKGNSKFQISNFKFQIPNSNSKFEIRKSKSILGFRVFRPPLRAIVQEERGCPREISAWDKNRSVYGKVVGAAGPWRTTGEWWRKDAWARDEWDVAIEPRGQRSEVSGQILYRIFRELGSGAWFVDGVYD
jgi:protein ImuB